MPFTLAHPVAVLPIFKKWPRLPFSALVIGSMAPDFPYFLLVDNIYYHIGHTRIGLFEFCLPVGFLVLIIFHYLVKFPLLSLLPTEQVEKLIPVARGFRLASLSDVLWNAFAIVLGAASHIFVDSFTHYNGWFVRHLPFLGTPFPIYKTLQYGGSLAGLWLLYYVYGKWLGNAPADPGAARSLHRLLMPAQVILLLCILFVVSLLVGIGHSALVFRHLGGLESGKKIFADGLESAMSSFAVGLAAFSVVWRLSARRTRKAN